MRDPGFVPEVGYLNSVSCTRVFYPALIKSDPGYGVDFPVDLYSPFPALIKSDPGYGVDFPVDLYSPFPALIKSDPGYGADFPVRPLLTLFCCFSSNLSWTNTGIPVLDLSSMDLGRLGLLDVYRMGWP